MQTTISPANASNTELTYHSSDESIATVDDYGLVTSIKAGNVTISVSTVNGLSATCQLSVVEGVEEFVKVTSLVNIDGTVEVSVDNSKKLNIQVNPANATIKDLIYYSSDESIVEVDNQGVITGKSIGNAIITVYAISDGFDSISLSQLENIKTEDEIQMISDHKVEIPVNVVESDYYTVRVICDENSYFYEDGNRLSEKTFSVKKGERVGYSPSSYGGYFCDGYYLEPEFTNFVTRYLYSYIPTSDITLYANYLKGTKITLQGNGGYFNDDVSQTSYT